MVLALCILSAAQTQRARSFASREPSEIVVLPLLGRQFDAVVVDLALGHGKHGIQHLGTELVGDPFLEHVARVAVAHTILDHVVQNAGDDRLLILPVSRQDDGDVRRDA